MAKVNIEQIQSLLNTLSIAADVVGRDDIGIGVRGESDHIGVLGGPGYIPIGQPSSIPDSDIFAGVVGIGPDTPGDHQFSYGGWFGRGPSADTPGTTAQLHLEPARAEDPNHPDAGQRGDLFVDHGGKLWFCTDTGDGATPATKAVWKQVQLT
jgi:hypothetical protein